MRIKGEYAPPQRNPYTPLTWEHPMTRPNLRNARPSRFKASLFDYAHWRSGVAICLLTFASTLAFSQDEVATYKKLSLQELMDLEVTSVSRRPEKLSDTASAIQVITGDDIRRSGASSIPEALRLATNLHVAQKNTQSWAISARGFNTELSNKLLVLMDGRTLYSPLFSGTLWEAQDYLLDDLERIEVISGPGGTLWGANAVNGVINITTKSAKDTQGLYTEAALGTELENLTGVRYGGTLAPNVYFRVYGKYAERDGNVLANGTDLASDWDARRAGFRIDAEPSPDTTFTFQGDIYDNDQDYQQSGLGLDVSGHNLIGRWTHTLANDSEMSLQLYYDHTRASRLLLPGIFSPTADRFTDTLDTYDMDFQHRLNAGERHHVVWGLGYRRTHDVTNNVTALSLSPDRLDQDLYSAFVQDEISLGAGWAFTLGSKVEHNDYTGFEFEPSARLQWNITPTHMLWSAVSRAVRMPSRIDREIRQPGTGFPILAGSDDFESEDVIAYEIGYRGQLASNLLVSISTFYNTYHNIRSLSPTPVTFFPLTFDNNLEGETYGVELSTTYEVTKGWRLQAGYTLLREDIRVKDGEVDLNNALNETADPRHQFSLRSSLDLPHNVELDTGLRWVDVLRTNNGGAVAKVPSYFELDVRLGWRPRPGLELSLVGQSLLHDQHAEYRIPGATNQDEIERSVYAKIVWRY
jgi:iron complex outermembrane receptor protein